MDIIEQAIAYFKLNITNIQAVEESYSSIVRILTLESGERLVLKIPFIARKLHRELYALTYLRDSLPIPQVVDVWQPNDVGSGALLMRLIPGSIISKRVTPALAYQLGNLLARLHTHKLAYFGDVFEETHLVDVGWWQTLEEMFHQWVPLCAAVLKPQLLQRAIDAFNRLSTRLPEPDGPCYTHFDYRPGNVLVQNQQITGLIDFESARAGSADLDFIKIKNEVWDVTPECRHPFLDGYSSVRELPQIERTLPLYSLRDAFGGIAWCVKRDALEDPFFDLNLRRLKGLLDETTA